MRERARGKRARSRECKTYTRGEPQKVLPEIAYIEHAFLMENKIKRLKHLREREAANECIAVEILDRHYRELPLARRERRLHRTTPQQPCTSSLDDGPNEMRWFGGVCVSANLCRPVNIMANFQTHGCGLKVT